MILKSETESFISNVSNYNVGAFRETLLALLIFYLYCLEVKITIALIALPQTHPKWIKFQYRMHLLLLILAYIHASI